MNAKDPHITPHPIGDHRPRPSPSARLDPSQLPAVCMLASGSKGNAIYLSYGQSRILIDAGLSAVEITRRLQSRSIAPESLNGIIVSHEHSDHIQGVGVLSRRYGLPVYISPKTEQARPQLGRLHRRHHFSSGTPFQVDAFVVRPFSTPHDAADPVGFTVSVGGVKIGIATDLGIPTRLVLSHLKDCHALILEANHDEEMLIRGPYPWPLKQRIQSRNGHLSNHTARQMVKDLLSENLQLLILAHLSETNNTPQKAFEATAPVLQHHSARLEVALQDRCGALFHLQHPGRNAG